MPTMVEFVIRAGIRPVEYYRQDYDDLEVIEDYTQALKADGFKVLSVRPIENGAVANWPKNAACEYCPERDTCPLSDCLRNYPDEDNCEDFE